MIDLVSGRTQMKRSGARVARSLSVPRRAHGLVLGRPAEEGLLLLRLPGARATRSASSARRRRSTSPARWSGWPTATASSSSTRRARPRPTAAGPSGTGCCSCWTPPPSFYQRFLWDAAEAEAARGYLAERGISRESADRFRLGYASAAPDRVRKAALSQRLHGRRSWTQAGLAARGGDRFRERLIFPLCDARGRVRGFGARQMPGGRPPKYLNTSDGPVFRKSDILYGLDHARRGDRPGRARRSWSRATPT